LLRLDCFLVRAGVWLLGGYRLLGLGDDADWSSKKDRGSERNGKQGLHGEFRWSSLGILDLAILGSNALG